jgi:hypothetical protein
MNARIRLASIAVVLALAGAWAAAQTRGEQEEFTATAIRSDNLGSGAGTVLIQITRWSTDAERVALVTTLRDKGPDALLERLRDMRPVGTIRTPDSLGYDLHYAQQTPGEDGGRRIVIATDRPIGFWEAWHRPRTFDYPFTVIQMNIGRDGEGQGTMSYATRVTAHDNVIELENYTSAPVMLTHIEARKKHED